MKITDIDNMNKLYEALGTNYEELYSLVNTEYKNLYKKGYIPKKNGTMRKIFVPNDRLLKIQRTLKTILDRSYRPHNNAMGFIKNKSILDNASIHINKNYLLNIDLENFFGSIRSGRVYAMFEKYFKITNKSVCFFLTKLCCHPDNFLPQGAPTSPTISNIITKMLDKELTELTKSTKYTVYYSRYADDITFSSNYPFDKSFLEIDKNDYKVGDILNNIIVKNGFEINKSKTRYQKFNQHQEVTGIVVNEKLNVNRKYIRNIRATLHSIFINYGDLDVPVNKFNIINKRNAKIDDVFRSIRGKISFVGMVKGEHDQVYQNLSKKFNEVLSTVNELQQLNDEEQITSVDMINVYSPYFTYLVPDGDIYYKGLGEMAYGQGSAFLLKNYGIISNYHVFEYIIERHEEQNGVYEIEKSKINNFDIGHISNIDYPVKLLNMENKERPSVIHTKIIRYSKEKDLILLQPENINYLKNGYDLFDKNIHIKDEIKVQGYPNFKIGNDVRIVGGTVIELDKSVDKFEIDTDILSGNSGGPILNSKNEVIGVASEGRGNHENIGRTLDWLNTNNE